MIGGFGFLSTLGGDVICFATCAVRKCRSEGIAHKPRRRLCLSFVGDPPLEILLDHLILRQYFDSHL